jgi:Leucine-rich repeat (LRR) protein
LTPPPTFDVELCLPSSLSTCPLAELDISHLAFPVVPSRVFLLTALVELHLHHNRLASLPTDMSRLERLLVLDVSHNAITYIPLEIARCSALECLNLAHNQLKELTPVVGKLQNLTMLDISANPLRELPPSVGQLTRLKSLLIEGVELDNVPKEIYQAGDSSAVRGFLLDISKGCEPLWRVKLMVAGQENVGKTSLLKCLTRKVLPRHSCYYDCFSIRFSRNMAQKSSFIHYSLYLFELG